VTAHSAISWWLASTSSRARVDRRVAGDIGHVISARRNYVIDAADQPTYMTRSGGYTMTLGYDASRQRAQRSDSPDPIPAWQEENKWVLINDIIGIISTAVKTYTESPAANESSDQ